MNKLGLLAGAITTTMLVLWKIPMGYATLPLFLFNDAGMAIGLFGMAPANTLFPLDILSWWFFIAAGPNVLSTMLVGALLWVLPLVCAILCFVGVGLKPKIGKRLYWASFFMLATCMVFVLFDALFIGEFFLSRTYGLVEFFLVLVQPGFWIFAFNIVVVGLAGGTYQEV